MGVIMNLEHVETTTFMQDFASLFQLRIKLTKDGTKRCQSLDGADCKIRHYEKRRSNNRIEVL